MSRDARSRVALGIGIPLGAFIFLGLLIVAFSRILLVVPESLAPWVALLFAVNILVGCALAATIEGTRGFTFLIGLLVATIVAGGVVGIFVPERPVHSLVEGAEHVEATPAEENQPGASDTPSPTPAESPSEEAATGGGGGGADAEPAEIGADALQFDTDELTVVAGAEAVIAFDNRDEGVPHNVSVYQSQGGTPIFQGEVITGPATIDYRFAAPAPGSYFFQCDVHPTTMTGTVTVQ